jgi:hypothetical protein
LLHTATLRLLLLRLLGLLRLLLDWVEAGALGLIRLHERFRRRGEAAVRYAESWERVLQPVHARRL